MVFMRRRFRSTRGRSWWWWRSYADRHEKAHIQLSHALVLDDASSGDPVGTFSVLHGQGDYDLTLTDDAGGLFALDGNDLEVADTLTAGTETVTVEADNGVDEPVSRSFSITVAAA